LDATVFLALVGCNSSGGATGNGGTTSSGATIGSGGAGSGGAGSGGAGSGGASNSGGTTGSSKNTGSGGITSTSTPTSSGGSGTKGSGGSGGATLTGGATSSGGRNGSGGSFAGGGGAPASGGITGSSGSTGGQGGTADAPLAGPDATAAYQGPCDVLAGGCAEAYGVARAMTASYSGSLFQLGLAKDKTKTLDVGQTSDHKADMTTWSNFCGDTQSNCVLSKIYAQIHTGSNDLLPAVWKAPWGPDCSAGGYTCAAKFTIETETGLPILTTVAPQEYALSGDNFSTGINGGTKAMGIMYNGKPVANQSYCCGVFGLTHKYDAPDTYGTDFMAALGYGWRDSGGNGVGINCGKSNTYCVGAEEEENNDLYDYGTSPVENAIVVTQFDPSANAVISYLNGAKVLSHSPPKATLNASTAIHLGGGGDLSQPDPILMREALITNNVMSASEVAALQANISTFFSPLKFP
jgi:hypothetical protein